MSQSASAHRNQSSSSNNNNNEKQQQPQIIELDSDDDDDDDDVMLLETFPPPPPRPVVCLVKTNGPLDYQDDCFCLKCRMIKEFLVKVECEPNDCTCKECRKTDTTRQDGSAANVNDKQQSQANNGGAINGNEVTHPQAPLEPTDNSPQPEAALSPENDDDHDDDERYSRSSTPEFDPFNDDDEDVEDEDEDGNEELNQGDGSNDSSNPKMSTSSSYATNKKDLKTNPNECPFCKSKAHNSTLSMSTHYRVAHLNWKPYYCKWTNCAFESGYSKAVETHVKWKHMKMEKKKQQNAAHYVGKHNEDQQPTDKLLSDHLLKNTGIKWPVTSALEPTMPICACPECGRRFARPDLLECHVESHDSAGFRCTWPNCGYFYSGSVTAAKLHICHDHLGSSTEYSLRDMKEAKRYLQPVGGASTSGPSTSATATNTQTTQPTTSRFASTNQNDDEDWSDYDDDNDGSSDASSSSHQSSQDELPEPINGEFICPHTNCLKRFPTQSRFKLHMITHTSQKPFECSCCSFKSNSESNLAKHFRRDHREKKLFRCAFPGCTYGNLVYSEVTQHIRLAHTAVLTKSRNLKKTLNKYVERCYLVQRRK